MHSIRAARFALFAACATLPACSGRPGERLPDATLLGAWQLSRPKNGKLEDLGLTLEFHLDHTLTATKDGEDPKTSTWEVLSKEDDPLVIRFTSDGESRTAAVRFDDKNRCKLFLAGDEEPYRVLTRSLK